MLNQEKKQSNPPSSANAYLKYSNIAFQLVVLILLAFYVGSWIDKKLGFTIPAIGMTLILVVFSGFMYKLYKELYKK